ncbi:MAG: DinB family protein [Bacteroidota bacterium]
MLIHYASLTELLDALTHTKAQTLSRFELSEADLDKTYAEGKWTVRQLLHHLADAETVLYDRIRRIIANPGQVIWAFEQDLWAEHLQYETLPLEINRQIYASVRDAVILLARTHYEQKGFHPFVHNETGSRTLKEEFEKIAWHNVHHLNQIEQAVSSE